jgi:coenzyme F420 hydrogenase subunit beta
MTKTQPGSAGEWGPVLKVWEGYAADEQLRFKGSSGGAATALAQYCIDHEGADGVLQTQPDPADPLRNRPVFSRSYEDLLGGTGSRYSPAGPCERFDWLLGAKEAAVFIGKPCDVAALAKFGRVFPDIGPRTAVSISIFCAGTPSTQGTIEILNRMGVETGQVTGFRYRGNGWPGKAVARSQVQEMAGELTYLESWGEILSRHVAFRCRLCPDSSGEFADISCGDPWYRTVDPDDPGRSMVIARTERGRQLVREGHRGRVPGPGACRSRRLSRCRRSRF